MLVFRFSPIMTLNGSRTRMDLYHDRVIIYPTGRLARWFPLFFGAARMIYLDEVDDAWLCPVRFQPTFDFRLMIRSGGLPDLIADCAETEFTTANQIIDYIEDYTSQGAFQPPENA